METESLVSGYSGVTSLASSTSTQLFHPGDEKEHVFTSEVTQAIESVSSTSVDPIVTISPNLFTQDMAKAKYPLALDFSSVYFKLGSLQGLETIRGAAI